MRHSSNTLVDPAAAASSGLFEQPVPRSLVHRASVSEVFLTSIHPDGPDRFLISAQWPRQHSFYRSRHGFHDPLIFAETIRQAGLIIGHAGYQVPLANPFILNGMEFDITPEGLARGGAPAHLMLEARCENIQRRGERLLGLDYRIDLYRDMVRVGTARCGFTCVSPAVYRRLRGSAAGAGTGAGTGAGAGAGVDVGVDVGAGAGAGAAPLRDELPPPVAPELVGQESAGDVVLSAMDRPGSWLLRCDPDHPVLFDHPVDHVPGMVVLEAMRQAAFARSGSRPLLVGCAMEFLRYAELGLPTEIHAAPEPARADGTVPVRVAAAQNGDIVAQGVLRVRPDSGA
ncbi:ScbA/BarX family gamma-butyrolactone biosynthesis protein [Streptomyces roseochromogenus]|uniref:A-factor biosynthesis hotdog domain-containing protein n=1 Tax=Streptomyces roseochromogenus subsp. oscitans DS 12.976 TaxID=1352936 RepID=V6K687_STRRC|nr:ScbA/BarX family gamma-butyrolactone biosynthesis protein [Streptomyces roseochromogenus]EST26921.1 hypothetical protein M878_26325 [Streptomyces roseochromogenus subsp. oscitans DS 12.976]